MSSLLTTCMQTLSITSPMVPILQEKTKAWLRIEKVACDVDHWLAPPLDFSLHYQIFHYSWKSWPLWLVATLATQWVIQLVSNHTGSSVILGENRTSISPNCILLLLVQLFNLLHAFFPQISLEPMSLPIQISALHPVASYPGSLTVWGWKEEPGSARIKNPQQHSSILPSPTRIVLASLISSCSSESS